MNNNCLKTLVEPCGHQPSQYRLHRMSIAPGPQGTLETLRIMAKLAIDAMQYDDFCLFMEDLCFKSAWSHSPDEIDHYLRSIYRYQWEDVETLYSPAYNAWQFQQTGFLTGDCDDICMMYAAVFHAMGYRSRFVAMRTKPNDPLFHHVVIEVHDRNIGMWRRYDATVQPSTVHVDYGVMVLEV